ncbi:hypothetical protein CBR_g39724 [Chara braunii]|uniref:Uncharacterized protein n=1 Tax=Chara braunii TaxID=69332 RepID=A0A388LSD5_CHABU|nr:hypothetical protein CBR_g39724 [Chara braunii]|eukprot:GBG85159.1 hypothetical protein CBR_g39724 [Chara braunii]
MTLAGNIRIMVGTLGGGLLGFYVMHQLEQRYKIKQQEDYQRYLAEREIRQRQEDEYNDKHQNAMMDSETGAR